MSVEQLDIYELLVVARDPSERKHKGSETSVAAHRKIEGTKEVTYQKILTLVKARGEFGASSKEIAYALGKQLHAISGRLSEMRAMGKLRDSGLRREGAAVLVVK